MQQGKVTHNGVPLEYAKLVVEAPRLDLVDGQRLKTPTGHDDGQRVKTPTATPVKVPPIPHHNCYGAPRSPTGLDAGMRNAMEAVHKILGRTPKRARRKKRSIHKGVSVAGMSKQAVPAVTTPVVSRFPQHWNATYHDDRFPDVRPSSATAPAAPAAPAATTPTPSPRLPHLLG